MFKSIVSGLIAVSVLATPVVAEARGRGDHRVERNHHGGRHHSRISTGEAIAIGAGALILGAALGSSRREREVEREVYDREYEYHRDRDSYYRPRNCYETIVTEYDDWGNRYRRRETRCF